MSTSVNELNNPTQITQIKTYPETRVNLSGVVGYTKGEDEKGAVVYTLKTDDAGQPKTDVAMNLVEGSKSYKEIFDAHEKLGIDPPTITKHQTFEYSEITDPSQIVPYFTSLGLNPDVAAKKGADIFQRGWAIAQQVEIRGFMQDDTQAEVAGAYSVAVEAATPGERRQKDPMAAAAASLKKAGFNIGVDDLKALMASMQEQNAGGQFAG
jgi:hypothetical protein